MPSLQPYLTGGYLFHGSRSRGLTLLVPNTPHDAGDDPRNKELAVYATEDLAEAIIFALIEGFVGTFEVTRTPQGAVLARFPTRFPTRFAERLRANPGSLYVLKAADLPIRDGLQPVAAASCRAELPASPLQRALRPSHGLQAVTWISGTAMAPLPTRARETYTPRHLCTPKEHSMPLTRQDHEPPSAIATRGWRYHHMGIPTNVPHPGERYLPHLGMYVCGFDTSPYGIEWMRFEPGCPISELIQAVPHIAFEVDDLEAALVGLTVISEISSPSEGVRVAMIIDNGAPIELIEFARNRR